MNGHGTIVEALVPTLVGATWAFSTLGWLQVLLRVHHDPAVRRRRKAAGRAFLAQLAIDEGKQR